MPSYCDRSPPDWIRAGYIAESPKAWRHQQLVFKAKFSFRSSVSFETDLWPRKHSVAVSHGQLGQHHLHFWLRTASLLRCVSALALPLPSWGVSSLDLGRLLTQAALFSSQSTTAFETASLEAANPLLPFVHRGVSFCGAVALCATAALLGRFLPRLGPRETAALFSCQPSFPASRTSELLD